MNFNSSEYFVFLALTLILYTLLFHRQKVRDIFLLCASYFFYMSWNWKYAGLILLSTSIDYLIGLFINKVQSNIARRSLLIISICTNLGILCVFKYFNFFVDISQNLTIIFGYNLNFLSHELLLPVGISFYTFQSLSYTIDLYRRKIEYEPNFIRFAVFVSFFPQLVAGPIVRAKQFLPQLHQTPNVDEKRFNSGLLLIFRGLFKKIIIADLLAVLAIDSVFANPSQFSSIDLIVVLYGYSFQIYNDFSGYSDIAIGTARMLGFNLPINFNRPYVAQNMREFWTRWHISLSTWLRDYLYIPLGGNRCKKSRMRINLMITMLLGGLWHGAAINFVLWGAWHGVLLILTPKSKTKLQSSNIYKRIVNRFICFHLIAIGWLLFRVDNFINLEDYILGILKFNGGTAIQPLYYIILIFAVLTHYTSKKWKDNFLIKIQTAPILIQAATYSTLIVIFLGMTMGAPAFIYFQF